MYSLNIEHDYRYYFTKYGVQLKNSVNVTITPSSAIAVSFDVEFAAWILSEVCNKFQRAICLL